LGTISDKYAVLVLSINSRSELCVVHLGARTLGRVIIFLLKIVYLLKNLHRSSEEKSISEEQNISVLSFGCIVPNTGAPRIPFSLEAPSLGAL
jgi:hypothetical protein